MPVKQLAGDTEDVLTGLSRVAPGLLRVRGLSRTGKPASLPPSVQTVSRAGVARVVLLSGGGARSTDTANAVSAYMLASEAAVRGSGVAWTILRPTAFMSNALRWAAQIRAGDTVREPFADVRVAVIDPADIAAVAAAALTTGEHPDRTYTLSGPEPLLPRTVCASSPGSSGVTCDSNRSPTRTHTSR